MTHLHKDDHARIFGYYYEYLIAIEMVSLLLAITLTLGEETLPDAQIKIKYLSVEAG